jgi:predicted MFS family arabinose efflux permease
MPIARDLGLARATVFGAFSVALLVMAAAGPAVGRAIDRAGGRNTLMLSNGVLAGGLVLLGLANDVIVLFAAWCVLGVGMAMGLYDAAFAALVHIYGKGARKAITGITLVAGFASTVGWPLTAFLDTQFGWRNACFVWAALHIVIALPVNAWGLPRTANKRASGSTHTADGKPDTAHVPDSRRRTFVLLAVFSAATAFVTSAFAAHLPGLLLAMGASGAAALIAASLLGPAQVAARLIEFGVVTRFQVHPLATARVATALHPVGALLLGVMGGPPAAAMAFALLHGAGNGMITIAKGTLPLALFGPLGYGLQQGWLGVGARTMQALAPYAFGLVLDGAGGRAALVVSSALSLLALGTLFLLRAPRTYHVIE